MIRCKDKTQRDKKKGNRGTEFTLVYFASQETKFTGQKRKEKFKICPLPSPLHPSRLSPRPLDPHKSPSVPLKPFPTSSTPFKSTRISFCQLTSPLKFFFFLRQIQKQDPFNQHYRPFHASPHHLHSYKFPSGISKVPSTLSS